MSNQYSRFGRDPNGGTVLDDVITTESMIRSTDFQRKLAAARAMREKVMAQREREAALGRRKNHPLAGPMVTSPSFVRAEPRHPEPEATMPELKGPVLDGVPRRLKGVPSFQLLAEPEPQTTSNVPPFVQRAKDIAQAKGQAGLVASRGAAEWVKQKSAQAVAALPSMTHSKAVASGALVRVGGTASTLSENGLTVATAMLARGRGGLAAVAGKVAAFGTSFSVLRQGLARLDAGRLPRAALVAGFVAVLSVGLLLWSYGGSQPETPLAMHQAKTALLETPAAQGISVDHDIPVLAAPVVVSVTQDRPTPALAAYDASVIAANKAVLPDLAFTPQAIGPVAVGSAPATSAWVPAQRFETQVAEALSLVSRSGFQPGSLPNSTVVDSDTPRLAPRPAETAVAVPETVQAPSTKYAVKRSLRPIPRTLLGQ